MMMAYGCYDIVHNLESAPYFIQGMVHGIVVRSPTIGQRITGDLAAIIGDQIGGYGTMCEQARKQAYVLMIEHASGLGANAVVGVRYESSEIGAQQSATEVLCYGTAVVVERTVEA